MAPEAGLSYEELRKRQQVERASPKLARLPEDFYRRLVAYLSSLEEEVRREQAANPASPKAKLLADELWNTRRLAEDLYEHRERKLMLAALGAARGASPDTTHMLPEELELYNAAVARLGEARRRALHPPPAQPPASAGAPPLGATAAPATTAPEAPRGDPPPAQPPPSAGAPPQPADGRTLVRLLEDVGAFTATDLRTYHARRDDVVSLPAGTARVLIERGKAVEVTPAP